MSNITKEGIEVKVGQVWRDLDGRFPVRMCEVIDIDEAKGRARMLSDRMGSPKSWVSIRRMHKGATGWALVEPTGEPIQEAKNTTKEDEK